MYPIFCYSKKTLILVAFPIGRLRSRFERVLILFLIIITPKSFFSVPIHVGGWVGWLGDLCRLHRVLQSSEH